MNRISTLALLVILLFTTAILVGRCSGNNADREKESIVVNTYIGDEGCKSCHAAQYNDWTKSDHFKAMQEPNDSTVLGNFSNVSFSADGVKSTFFKRGDKFIINTQGEDGRNHDYEVKYTFGYHPLQQYLVAFPGGRLQATRVSWDSRQNKWFHQYTGQKINPHDWLNWTGNAQNWNTMCAECHSTDLKKNYDIQTDTYHTTYSVINVSCEVCHGPGKLHADFFNSESYRKGKKPDNKAVYLASGNEQHQQINMCAPCHSVKSNISANLVASEELLDNFIPVVPTTERYFADGQIRDEDYEYSSFLQSKMYRRGVECSNCHNPHSGKTYFTTNDLCLQCHAKTYDEPTHTFHAVNTAGSQCINCHMSQRTYMGNDLRRDHSFRAPRPDLSVKFGTPNTCNSCHKEKTAQWAADAVSKWFGAKRQYHFSEDLIPGSRLNAASEQHLGKLLADTSVPSIIKATALNYLGNISSQTSFNLLLSHLKNGNAQIRYEALRSLMNFPFSRELNVIAPLLNDKVRAVRIAAADLLLNVPKENIPAQYQSALATAMSELNNYKLHQADFAHGNIVIGDYFSRMNDLKNAETFYLRAIQKDSLANLSRINLSTVYNREGKNTEALKVLEQAKKIDDKNFQIYYNLALLHNEMGNKEAALHNFELGFRLHPDNPRFYYNYGLLLQQSGNVSKAIEVLDAGIKTDPNSASLYYALAYIYLQDNQTQQAIFYATKLKKLDPDNPEYQGLFSNLGIR